MFCTEWSLVKEKAEIAKATPLYCRSWRCEVCAPRRRQQLIAQALRGEPNSFITITSRKRDTLTADQAAVELVEAWRTIVRRACKKYGYRSIPYICVFESTKQGWPHLHILARCAWIDQRWLSEQMAQLADSPNCWIERVYKRKKVAAYCAKYISKDPHRFLGTKRYWQTQDYPDPNRDDEALDRPVMDSKTVRKVSTFYIEEEVRALGGYVHQRAPELIYSWSIPPPDEPTEPYP